MTNPAAVLAIVLCACAAVVALEPRARYDGVASPGAGARPVYRLPPLPSSMAPNRRSPAEQIANFSPLPLLPK